MTKQEIANRVLWIAFILALIASLVHVSWVFGRLEFGGQRWLGWLPSIALNAGLAALAYMIQQRKLAQRPTLDLWLGVIGLIGVSAFANLLYALAVQIQGNEIVWATFGRVDALDLVRAISMSAILPLFVVYLGNVVSADDVAQVVSQQQTPAQASASADENSTVQTFLSRLRPVWQRAGLAVKSWLAPKAPSPDASPAIDEPEPSQRPEKTPSPRPEPGVERTRRPETVAETAPEQQASLSQVTAQPDPGSPSLPASQTAPPDGDSRPNLHRPSFPPPPLLSNPITRRSQGSTRSSRHRSTRPPTRPYQALQRLRKRAGAERFATLDEM